jgi:hypothetical protein
MPISLCLQAFQTLLSSARCTTAGENVPGSFGAVEILNTGHSTVTDYSQCDESERCDGREAMADDGTTSNGLRHLPGLSEDDLVASADSIERDDVDLIATTESKQLLDPDGESGDNADDDNEDADPAWTWIT